MYERVLVPVDGRDPSTVALEHGLEIAADHGATVHLRYVADTNRPSLVQYEGAILDVLEREGDAVLDDARERAAEWDVPVVDDVVQGDPRTKILEAAADADLVVMGTHGRSGIESYLLGSVTEHVVNASDTPVLALRADATVTYPYEAVLVPYDGSPHAQVALDRATEVADHSGATIHLLAVVEKLAFVGLRSSVTEGVEENARESIEAAANEVDGADVVTAVETGSVPDAIGAYADESDVGLIVMGTHGSTGIDDRLLGSTTERVLRTAPVPVLTTTAD